MALTALTGGVWIPTCTTGFFTYDETVLVIDASGEKAALILQCPKAGVLDRFDAHVAVVTNSPDNGLRFSFQTVSDVTGLPTGTLLGATTNAQVTYAHPVTTGWKSTTFAETVTVTRGQKIACVIDIPSFTAGDSVTMRAYDQQLHGFPYGISATSTRQGVNVPIIGLHYTDGYAYISPTLPAITDATNLGVNVNTAGADEYALAFSLPFPYKLNAVQAILVVDAGADFEWVLYDSDGTTVLAVLTYDGDVTSSAGLRAYHAFLQSEVTLLANTTYRLSVRPTTVNNVAVYFYAYPSLAAMESKPGGGAFFLSTRLNQGGSWTDYNSGTFRCPHYSLNVSALDDGVSAGGGGGGQGSTIYLTKRDAAVQKWNPSKTVDITLAAGDTGKNDVLAVKSANHQLWVQKITYNPVTVAAQAVTFQDDAGTPVKIGVIPASQATPITLDFGPKGVALTAGKNLDISNTAGPAAQIHIEAYEKIVSGAISTGTAAASQ